MEPNDDKVLVVDDDSVMHDEEMEDEFENNHNEIEVDDSEHQHN